MQYLPGYRFGARTKQTARQSTGGVAARSTRRRSRSPSPRPPTMRASTFTDEPVPYGSQSDMGGHPKGVSDENAWFYRHEVSPLRDCPDGFHTSNYKKFLPNAYCIRDCDQWDRRRSTRNDGRCGPVIQGTGGKRRNASKEGPKRAPTAYNEYTRAVNVGVKNLKPTQITQAPQFKGGWADIKTIAANSGASQLETIQSGTGRNIIQSVIEALNRQ